MLSLVLKDFSEARWFLLLIVPLFALQLLGLGTAPPAFVLVTLLFSGLFAFGSLGIEEIQGTGVLWCSLPVSRHGVVLARYVTTLLGTVMGLGISWTVGSFAPSWAQGSHEGSIVPVDVRIYASLFFMITVAAALYLPCYFRWGAGKGLQMFAIVVLGIVVAGAVIGSLLVSFSDGAPPDVNNPAWVAAVEDWVDRWGGVLGVATVVVALLGMSVSAALSARLYETRDC